MLLVNTLASGTDDRGLEIGYNFFETTNLQIQARYKLFLIQGVKCDTCSGDSTKSNIRQTSKPNISKTAVIF